MHIYIYNTRIFICTHINTHTYKYVNTCINNPSNWYSSLGFTKPSLSLVWSLQQPWEVDRVGLLPPVYRYLWLRQRLQGPSGLEAVTVPLSTVMQTDFMSTGRAVPTSGPERMQSQGKPEASPVSGLHFTDRRTEAQRVAANLYGVSVQIRKKTSIPSLRHLPSTYLKTASAFWFLRTRHLINH